MKKAANILCLISGILGIFTAITYAILAIVFLVGAGAGTQAIIQGLQDGTITVSGYPNELTAEQAAALYVTIFTAVGVVMAIMLVFAIVEIVLLFRARKVETQGSYIAVLVVGILSGNVLALVAGILGLVGKDE